MAHHHHHRYHGGNRTNPLLIVLIVVLAAGLVGFLVYDHIQEEKRAAELRVIEQQEREERRAKEEARKAEEKRIAEERAQQRAQDSFYQMLADGFDVNVLIVGDSIGAGHGASDADHR